MTIANSDLFARRQQKYAIPYHVGESNHCPGCGRQNWIIGRLVAECAFCGMALAMEHVHGYGAIQRYSSRGERLRTVA